MNLLPILLPVAHRMTALYLLAKDNQTASDPLINQSFEIADYFGIILLGLMITVAIGVFSRRFEYALLFAAALSVALIAFFFL